MSLRFTFFLFFFPYSLMGSDCDETFLAKKSVSKQRTEFLKKVHLKILEPIIRKKISKKLIEICKTEDCNTLSADRMESVIQEANQEVLKKSTTIQRFFFLNSIILTTSGLTSWASSHLPNQLQFLTFYLTQVSLLGTLVIGSPIFEPLGSKIRHWAFGRQSAQASLEAPNNTDGQYTVFLEEMWERTQKNYSINAQMSRNIIEIFLRLNVLNFQWAFSAYSKGEISLASNYLLQGMLRMVERFPEIPLDAPVVLQEVQLFFPKTEKLEPKRLQLRESLETKIEALEKTVAERIVLQDILKYWL